MEMIQLVPQLQPSHCTKCGSHLKCEDCESYNVKMYLYGKELVQFEKKLILHYGFKLFDNPFDSGGSRLAYFGKTIGKR